MNGRFSPEQKLIYEVVHSVQADLIKLLQNYPSLDNLFDNMCVLLGKRLQEIGLIPQNVPSELLFKVRIIVLNRNIFYRVVYILDRV